MTRQRKDGHVLARNDDDELLLLDDKPPKRTQTQIQTQNTSTKKPAAEAQGSDTEDDSDSEQPASKKPNYGQALPTPTRSLSPIDIDPGRAPGRIIGATYPLQDFQKNLSQGDVVSKAVEDLGFVIKEIVMKPFASRRNGELLECMTTFRDVALKVCCSMTVNVCL